MLPTTVIDQGDSGSVTITVTGAGTFAVGNLTFPTAGGDKITTATCSTLNFTGTVDLTNGEIEAKNAAATLDFDGAVSGTGTLDLVNAGVALNIGGNFDMTNITFAATALDALTDDPAITFDGTTEFTPLAATTLPDTTITGAVTQAGFDMVLAGGKNLVINDGADDSTNATLTMIVADY